uniref:Uncharacterized protein n=1 Tax=Anguilla anguilla TaxID=7936 RepID=A0A0E9USR2_ANGAN
MPPQQLCRIVVMSWKCEDDAVCVVKAAV